MTELLTMDVTGSERADSHLERERPDDVEALTRGLAKGNEKAFTRFFADYARRLLVYLIVLTNGEEELAKELLQETMIRVAKYVRVFPSEDHFWSWLTRLARSCWIDAHRKRTRYRSLLDFFWRSSTTGQTPAVSHSQELCAELLETLSEDERELLLEKYLEGKSVKELAQARGTSEKAVESSLTRARQKLKRRLS